MLAKEIQLSKMKQEKSASNFSIFMRKVILRSFSTMTFFSGFTFIKSRLLTYKLGPRLTVLVYHNVTNNIGDRDRVTISPTLFEKQMAYLKKNYKVVSFSDVENKRNDLHNRDNYVILTFDDGYKDYITNAVPILTKYGLKACFFITTNFIDHIPSQGYAKTDLWSFRGMSWHDVRMLHEMNFEIGSHASAHRNLMTMSLNDVQEEINSSKMRIESEIGSPVNYFAFPMGKKFLHYDDTTKSIVSNSFKIICSTNRGRNNLFVLDLSEIKRICVQNWWSQFDFAREIDGTFDAAGRRLFPL